MHSHWWPVVVSVFLCACAGAAEPAPAPAKPVINSLEPRGLQRGVETKIKLTGTGLNTLTNVTFQVPQLKGELLPEARTNEVWIKVTAAADLARGAYELSVKNTAGESGRLKLQLDDLPQIHAARTANAPVTLSAESLPVSFWGTLDTAGVVDQFEFPAKAGETLVFDLAADSLGSKAKNTVLTLVDARGAVLASNNGFDGGADPLLAHRFANAGRYRVRVSDAMAAASKDHFYRLSVGAFAYVTGFYPLSVTTNTETALELAGYNLAPGTRVRLKAGAAGDMPVPIDANHYRSRGVFKVLVSEGAELVEIEPNDTPETATPIRIPGAVNGRIWNQAPPASLTPHHGETPAADVDLFRFEAKAGQPWIIETMAARRGSPIDTKIEVLHADGQPVQRLLLQATRDSYITFRGIDSNTADARLQNWEEMELNQFLYMQGEICKLFRAPQGPDSGFNFYTMAGKRRAFFDTSATAHANDEPCYIVEPHPPGTKLVANGLPVFPLFYANDDDGERKLGSDSKLQFTAPKDGAYLIRVTDTRGFGGDRFAYRLVVRAARPDFLVTLNGANPEVNAGSGKSFSVSADRIDGYDGEIIVEINGLPPGFTASTPLVIQAGHDTANGTLNAATNAPQPTEANWAHTKVNAHARVNGQSVTKDVNNLGRIKLADKPKLFVALEPETAPASPVAGQPLEITIAPGQMIPVRLKVRRNGHDDLITFTVDNLPHGVIVDNIGLNGVLIPKGENERQIFLSAARWVPETDRLCYAVENQVGRQTSLPVLIKVRKPAPPTSAAK